MTRRAILQIGTEKTGTTTLQNFLSVNRAALAGKGFHYPKFCGNINHTGLAAYAMSPMKMDPLRAAYGIAEPRDVGAMRERFRAAAAAELDGTRTAIFCNEHCHSRLNTPDEVATLRDFLALHFDAVDVCIYLRRQDQVAVSLYSTRLKSGGTGTDILPKTNGEDPYFNYDRSLALWEDAFGRENLTVRIFDRASLEGGSVVTDFLKLWRIGAPSDFEMVANQNESVAPVAQDFLRRLNAHVAPIAGLPLDAVLGPLSASLAQFFPGGGAKPARAEARAFYTKYAAANEAVRARHFPERAHLFDEDFAGYPEEASSREASADDIAEVAAKLIVENARQNRRLEAEIAIREARLLWERDEREPALAALRRAVTWLPCYAPSHRVMGEFLLKLERYQQAAAAARKAAEHCPDNFEFWHFLGVVLRLAGDLDGAEAAQRRALALNPDHEASRHTLEALQQEKAQRQDLPPAARSA